MQKIFAVTMLSLLATGAFAKGHDQGSTAVPGADTGTETVAASHALGGIKGNRPDGKGPTDSPAIVNAGR